jgi:hypothetical protein
MRHLELQVHMTRIEHQIIVKMPRAQNKEKILKAFG